MFSLAAQNPILFEMIGVCGFCLYVLNYTLLTLHKFSSHDARYFALNLAAAAMVLIGLMASFNLASAMIQSFWVVISTAAILLRLKRRHLRWAAPRQKPGRAHDPAVSRLL